MKRLLFATLLILPLFVNACDTAGPDDGGDPPSDEGDKAVVQSQQTYA